MGIFTKSSRGWGPFLESPETFRAHFGRPNSPCIFKTKASRGSKLCSYLYFYSPYNIRRGQLYRISRSEFYEWLFGLDKFSGLSRNEPLGFLAFCPQASVQKLGPRLFKHGRPRKVGRGNAEVYFSRTGESEISGSCSQYN